MSMEIYFKCDICREDPNPNYFGLRAHVYGVQGENSSEDFKFNLNLQPDENDDINICHECLQKLSDKFIEMDKRV